METDPEYVLPGYPKEEKMMIILGAVFAVFAAACLVPATRRRLAEQLGPMLDRVGQAPASEVLRAAASSAAAAAAAGGAKKAVGA
jgi:hypothetical protein